MRSLLVLLVASAAAHGAVTPIDKVIALLSKLESQIAEDGKVEAAQYDKYACFCKEEADGKTYAIEKSEKKIEQLDAKIEKFEADIADLNRDISSLSEKITGLEQLISDAETQRELQHERYVGHNADVTAAIKATKGAIEALKASKAGQAGDVKLDLAQLQALSVRVLGADALALSLQAPGKPHAVQYQSNDIIATLQGLLVKFKGSKKALDQAEFEENAAFERKRLGYQNEKKFSVQEKTEKEASVDKKTEELNAAEDDRTATTQDKDADVAFRTVLKDECETKAQEFDQRSSARSAEITAIAQALDKLKSGVKPNEGANKKLVGLQRGAVHGHWSWVEDTPGAHVQQRPASFLQIRDEAAGSAAVVKRVVQLLTDSASRLGSPTLSAIAMKALVQGDHFVKVRQLINDLIARLESDAEAEATQKSMCDEKMGEAVTSRDSSQETIEDKTASISGKNAEVAQTTAEVAELKAEIAANLKALNEATELRATEKAENEKTSKESSDGAAGVEFALSVLQEFYGSLLQTSYVPPNSDREGKTVGDRAPEVFQGEYHGKGDAAKGIIGILEVIQSDFERTHEKTEEDETAAQEEFEQLETDIKEENEQKDKQVTAKETRITELNDDVVVLRKEKRAAQTEHGLAKDELEKLQALCVEGEETWEQRKASREKEISALKDALNILREWQA